MNEIYGGTSALLGQVKAPDPTAFMKLDMAMKAISEAETRAGKLADRLAGDRGEAGAKPALSPVPHGLIGEVEGHARSLDEIAANIIRHVSRIEDRL